jgi:hypothetical protein
MGTGRTCLRPGLPPTPALPAPSQLFSTHLSRHQEGHHVLVSNGTDSVFDDPRVNGKIIL